MKNLYYGNNLARILARNPQSVLNQKPIYTTRLERLGHRIQAHAILLGDDQVASMPASELGELGSYDAAKASLSEATVTPNGIEFAL